MGLRMIEKGLLVILLLRMLVPKALLVEENNCNMNKRMEEMFPLTSVGRVFGRGYFCYSAQF